jgi:hypothetical protein
MRTAVLIGWDPARPQLPPPGFGLVLRGRNWSAKIDDISPVEEGEVVRRYPDTRPAQVDTLEPVVHVHAVLNVKFKRYFQIKHKQFYFSRKYCVKKRTGWRRPITQFSENCLRNIRKLRQFSHIFAKISSCFRVSNAYKKGKKGILKNSQNYMSTKHPAKMLFEE